ncbi:hypothetical protein BC941DRAFT_430398 [Chlamydoabsidia padenii]|nr:hypothetical protein BC941DRAFT_430398 [Chlamydoabsidia padenii]
MKNCCFCISLRTATLMLALLGTLTHFYSGLTLSTVSFEDYDSGVVFALTLYSYLSGWACLAGAMGVLKNNVKRLRLFNVYYWVDLVLHSFFAVGGAAMLFVLHTNICEELTLQDTELDMETCEAAYITSAWIVTIAMALNMLLKLHFAFAIHSYYKRIQQQTTTALVVVTMDDEQKEEIKYVAGKEFIPDDKKTSLV